MNSLLKKIGYRFLLILLTVGLFLSGFNILIDNNISKIYASTKNYVTCQSFAQVFSALINNSNSLNLNVSSISSSGIGSNFIIPVTEISNSSKVGNLIVTVYLKINSSANVVNSYCKVNNTTVNQINVGNISSVESLATLIQGTNNFIIYFYKPTSTSTSNSTSKYSVSSACGGNSQCISCVSKGGSTYQYIYTDFGCIDTSLYGVINFVYKIVLTLAFMLAFAVIIFAGYLIMVSGGDPEKLGRGKSLMTKSIIGLLVIIFAFIILTSIGAIFNIQFLQYL